MEKISFEQMCAIFRKHNEDNHITYGGSNENYLVGVIVYKPSNWPDKNYSLESRSYRVTSDNKYFFSGMGGSSLYGGNLDGTDKFVRLDYQCWEVDYCYLTEKEQ